MNNENDNEKVARSACNKTMETQQCCANKAKPSRLNQFCNLHEQTTESDKTVWIKKWKQKFIFQLLLSIDWGWKTHSPFHCPAKYE